MMDILTVLLLFLLKSFVVEGEVMTPAPGVILPESSSDTKPRASVVVAIFDDAILLDGQHVATISKDSSSGDLLIDVLADQLDSAREQMIDIARQRGNDDEFEGTISIQGDREISFDILQRVMYTCNMSGYDNISLAVLGTS
jgi:biopolymer transport protein ExbD